MGRSADDERRKRDDAGLGDLVGDLLGPSIASPTFAGYQVVAEIGVGGMGQVWRAKDLALGREVAVKTIKPDLTPVPNMKERFLREVRALARVKSDHVVAVHHVGEARDAPFVVMELLHGESMHARLRRDEKLSIADVIAIGVQACAGLDAIHREGLVHRDVKPSNLWLEDRGEGSFRLKVLDFGLVRSTGDDSTLTNSGALIGTPAYMSPEQAAGLPVEPSSDLFSLGCVLYHCLCGQRPFGAHSPFLPETSLGSWEFPSIAKLRPDAPPQLVAIVGSLLSRDPKRRPKSAKQVGQQLAAMAGDFPQAKALSRHWGIPVLATLAVCAVAIGTAFFWPKSDRPAANGDGAPEKKTTPAVIQSEPLKRELPEWAKGRRIRSVAADGSGEFKSIQSAFNAVEPGEAIELVGPGPFREVFTNRREATDIGLFSRSGSVVELTKLTKNDSDADTVDGAFLGGNGGFRLSGIEFRFPTAPPNATVVHAVNLWGSGAIVVEDCVFWQPTETGEAHEHSPYVMGVVVHVPRPDPIEIRIVGNLFRCGLAVMDYDNDKAPADVRTTIERNLFVATKDAMWIAYTRGNHTIRGNVVSAVENGVGLIGRDESSKDFQFQFENNTVVANQLVYLGEHKETSVGKAKVVNNVVANRRGTGINFNTSDKSALEKEWVRTNNWYARELEADDTLDVGPEERVESKLLESDVWTNPRFARLRSDSPAATGGRGGELPTYAGAVAPNAAADADWLAKLRSHPAAKGN